MRLALSLAFALALLVLAAGCGGDGDDEEAAPAGGVITQTTAPEPQSDDAGDDAGAGEEAGADGRTIFLENCSGCHTLRDAGTTGKVGPNLDRAKPSFERVRMMVTNGGGGGLGVMPSFKGSLSTEKIEAVSRYVSESAGK